MNDLRHLVMILASLLLASATPAHAASAVGPGCEDDDPDTECCPAETLYPASMISPYAWFDCLESEILPLAAAEGPAFVAPPGAPPQL